MIMIVEVRGMTDDHYANLTPSELYKFSSKSNFVGQMNKCDY